MKQARRAKDYSPERTVLLRLMPMVEIKIRPMTIKDVDAVIKIEEKISGEPRPAYWRANMLVYLDSSYEDLSGRSPVVWRVAEVDGKVVGMIIGGIRLWAFGIAEAGWLEVLGVDPDYRGCGVAKKLIEDLFAYFKCCGVNLVYSLVDWADGELLSFFKHLGFRRGDHINLVKDI